MDRHHTSSVDEYNELLTANHERLERLVYAMDHLPAIDPPLTFALIEVLATQTGLILHLKPKLPHDKQRLQWLNTLANHTLGPLYKLQDRSHLTLAYQVPGADKAGGELAAAVKEVSALFADVDVVVRVADCGSM